MLSKAKYRPCEYLVPEYLNRPNREDEGSNDYLVGRRHKKLKYALVSEDWGDSIVEEEEDSVTTSVEQNVIAPAPQIPMLRTNKRTNRLTPSCITDYFPKKRRMDEFEMDGDWDDFVDGLSLSGSGGRMEDGPVDDQPTHTGGDQPLLLEGDKNHVSSEVGQESQGSSGQRGDQPAQCLEGVQNYVASEVGDQPTQYLEDEDEPQVQTSPRRVGDQPAHLVRGDKFHVSSKTGHDISGRVGDQPAHSEVRTGLGVDELWVEGNDDKLFMDRETDLYVGLVFDKVTRRLTRTGLQSKDDFWQKEDDLSRNQDVKDAWKMRLPSLVAKEAGGHPPKMIPDHDLNQTQEGGVGVQKEDRCPESGTSVHSIHPSAGINPAGLTVDLACSPELNQMLSDGQFVNKRVLASGDDDRSGGGRYDDEGGCSTEHYTMVSDGMMNVERRNQEFPDNLARVRAEPSVGSTGGHTGNSIMLLDNNILDAVVPELQSGREERRIQLEVTTPPTRSVIIPVIIPSPDPGTEDDMTGTSTPRRQEDEVKESPLMSRDCVYAAGGVCETHGEGAKRYWRPRGSSRVRGVGGSGRKIPEREYYYQCDREVEGS